MTADEIKNTPKKRPFGISIIALLNILKGMIGLMILLYASTFDEQGGDKLDVVMEYFERFVYLIIGIGISLGKRWAWWIFVFLLAFNVFHNVFTFLTSEDILVKAGLTSNEITKYFYKLGAATLFQTILIVYLFQKNVFNFFKFEYTTLKKKLALVFGINIILVTVIILIELYS
jgi:hypothetical protein